MSEVFLKIVNMSISASWIVLAVLLLRLLLKKAPKWITVLLWGVVALRLILPYSIESVLSLIPSAETISPDILTGIYPSINTGISAINHAVNPIISGSFAPTVEASANPLQILIPVLSALWIVVTALMLAYSAISYFRIRRNVRTAVLLRENIFQCETVESPFVLGIINPKIYLPFNLSEQDESLVIAHEEAHIKRKDHFWKPFGFLLLSVHWFNPLMWLGYILLCRDIEIACDEKVAGDLTKEQRADYSQALLTCSVNRRMIAACPLAFGEVGVKDRVKNILNYKKPAFWLVIVAIIALVITSVCLLTDPASNRLKNIEFLSLDSRANDTVAVWVSNGEVSRPVMAFGKDELQKLLNLKISENEISQDRGENREASHTIILQAQHNVEATAQSSDVNVDGLYISFDSDFTSVWAWNDDKPTLSYKVKEPEKARELFNLFRERSVGDTVIADNTVEYIDPVNNIYLFKSDNDRAGLTLSATDNTGSFCCSLFSSYMAYGTYEDDGKYIVLKTDDGQNEYTFKKTKDGLKFVAKKSSTLPSYKYSSGAKPEICVPNGAVFEKLQPEFANTTDSIVFDIDKDGIDETCVLGYGPTSGLFTFTLTVSENGKAEYFNTYHSPTFFNLFFIVQDNVLKLKGMTQGDEPETELFDFIIEGDNISIKSPNYTMEYWGKQGLK